jgi:hypothetical protein
MFYVRSAMASAFWPKFCRISPSISVQLARHHSRFRPVTSPHIADANARRKRGNAAFMRHARRLATSGGLYFKLSKNFACIHQTPVANCHNSAFDRRRATNDQSSPAACRMLNTNHRPSSPLNALRSETICRHIVVYFRQAEHAVTKFRRSTNYSISRA